MEGGCPRPGEDPASVWPSLGSGGLWRALSTTQYHRVAGLLSVPWRTFLEDMPFISQAYYSPTKYPWQQVRSSKGWGLKRHPNGLPELTRRAGGKARTRGLQVQSLHGAVVCPATNMSFHWPKVTPSMTECHMVRYLASVHPNCLQWVCNFPSQSRKTLPHKSLSPSCAK